MMIAPVVRANHMVNAAAQLSHVTVGQASQLVSAAIKKNKKNRI